MKNRIRKWKDSRKKGASMGIVICVAALLIAFSLVMVHTGSMMMATANQRMRQERCYQLAKSFAESLESQLIGEATDTDFQKFAKQFMESIYQEYNPDDPTGTMYTYETDTPLDESYGRISITLYKEPTDEEDLTAYKNLPVPAAGSTGYSTVIQERKDIEHCRYTLSVMVTAAYEDASYSYVTEYDYKEQMGLRFQHDGKEISWSETDNNWKDGTSGSAADYTGTINDSNPVKYRYDISDVTKSYFDQITYEWENTGGAGP